MDNAAINGMAVPVQHATGQVKLVGSYTNRFTASSDFWRMQNVTFVARSNNTALEFTGITPGVWLDHVMLRETGRRYYFPEEPLAPIVGQQAQGDWRLEVWDSRLGAAVTNANLLSWQLHLTYIRTNPPLVRLTNHVPAVGVVVTNGIRYFAVDVTCDSGEVTNTLMSLTPGGAVDLLFNQETFPTGSEPGDVLLLSNTSSNVSVLQVGSFPLTRAGRYFLGVRNSNPAQNNAFLIRIDSNCARSGSLVKGLRFNSSGFGFSWTAEPDVDFAVEYADDPAGPWTEIPRIFASENGEFSFVDDGSLTGGLSPRRFYRLRRY
jgi:hypothetical protein